MNSCLKPKISIVSATFNVVDTIEALAVSIASQAYDNVEWIVADGGSTDGTLEVLQHCGSTLTALISGPDQGIFDAWNKALDKCTGEWILFLGGDDRLVDPATLSEIVPQLNRVDAAKPLAYGRCEVVDRDGNVRRRLGAPWNALRFRTEGMTIPHQATFHRSSMFDDGKRFEVRSDGTSTYEFLLGSLWNQDAAFLDRSVAIMGYGGVSTSPENQLRFMMRYIQAQRRYGVFRLRPRLIAYLGQAVLRRVVHTISRKP